jgi:hypothetical protein
MTVNVLVPADGTLELGSGPLEVICQCTAVVLEATQAEVRTETMCEVATTYGREEFVLVVDYLQDWTPSTGISWYLWTQTGNTVAFTWAPENDEVPRWTGTLRVRRPSAGGAAGQHARATARLAIVGTPSPTFS